MNAVLYGSSLFQWLTYSQYPALNGWHNLTNRTVGDLIFNLEIIKTNSLLSGLLLWEVEEALEELSDTEASDRVKEVLGLLVPRLRAVPAHEVMVGRRRPSLPSSVAEPLVRIVIIIVTKVIILSLLLPSSKEQPLLCLPAAKISWVKYFQLRSHL